MKQRKKTEKDISVEYLDEEDKKSTGSTDESVDVSDEESEKKTNEASKDKHEKIYEEMENKYNDLNDQFLRVRAEFANYKKRVERDQIEFTGYLKAEFMKKLLPIIDDFNQMIVKSESRKNQDSVLEGAQLIYNKLIQMLEMEGLQKIEALGKEFDPQLHEAIMMQKISDRKKHNKVIDIFQEGFSLNNRLIRPSKVVVGDYIKKEQ